MPMKFHSILVWAQTACLLSFFFRCTNEARSNLLEQKEHKYIIQAPPTAYLSVCMYADQCPYTSVSLYMSIGNNLLIVSTERTWMPNSSTSLSQSECVHADQNEFISVSYYCNSKTNLFVMLFMQAMISLLHLIHRVPLLGVWLLP